MKLKNIVASKSAKPAGKATPPVPAPSSGRPSAHATPAKGQPVPAAPKPEKRPTPSNSGANTGVKHGLRVMAFQDRCFKENDSKVRPTLGGAGFRTDEELAKECCQEFPHSLAVQRGRITAAMIASIRNQYNNGTGGHGTPGQRASSRPYVIDAKGNRTPSDAPARTRTAASKAQSASAVPAATAGHKASPAQSPAKTPATVAASTARIVTPQAAKGAKNAKKVA